MTVFSAIGISFVSLGNKTITNWDYGYEYILE